MTTVRTREDLGGDYRSLLVGSGLSNLGDGVRLAALPLLAVSITDEPVLVSGVTAATLLPAVLLGPFGGVVIDRYDRRRLLVVGQLLRGVVVAAFVALLLTDAVGIGAVYALAVVLGAGEVVVDGAAQAVVPQLVGPSLLERANARLIRAQLVLDEMVGVALGGVLFSVGAALPFVLDSASFLLGALAVGRIGRPLPPRERPDHESSAGPTRERDRRFVDELRDGVAFLRQHPVLGPMAATLGLTNTANTIGVSVLVLLVVDELGASDATYGIVLGVAAVGGFVGSLVAERIVRALGRARTLVLTVAATSVTNLAMAASPNVVAVSAVFGVYSFAIVTFNVPGRAVRQEVTPSHLLGRVVTTFRTLGFLGVPLGALVGGVVTDRYGVRWAFVLAAAVLVVGTLAMAAAVRHLPAADGRATGGTA